MGGGITRTFRLWTHTSDDSYIYQLSLVVATATLYLLFIYQVYIYYLVLVYIYSACKAGMYSPTRTCSTNTIDRARSRTTVCSEGSAFSSSVANSRFLPSGRRHEGHVRKPSELDAYGIMQTRRIPPDAHVRRLIWQARTQKAYVQA